MWYKSFLVTFALLVSTSAWAQNPQCPTRPYGDSSNACASTAFVQQAVGISIQWDPVKINAIWNPQYPKDMTAGGQDIWNIILAPNASTTTTFRSTIVGVMAHTLMEYSERCDGFGQGVFRYARYCNRNFGFGSITLEWIGQDLTTDPNGRYYLHAVIDNENTPVTDPAWDKSGAETRNPGIRNTIVNWMAGNPWATSASDVQLNSAFARDALNNLLKGNQNSAFGYRSCALSLEANNNTCIGNEAGYMNFFGNNNTFVGDNSGYNNQQGNYQAFLGRVSGFSLMGGSGDDYNVMLGGQAGYSIGGNLYRGTGNIWIGGQVGQNNSNTIPNGATFNHIFLVQSRAANRPLMYGDLSGNKLMVGLAPYLAASPGSILGTLHVRTSAVSGLSTPGGNFDDLVVEVDGSGGMTIGVSASSVGGICVATPSDNNAGCLSYATSTDTWTIRAADASRATISGTAAEFTVPMTITSGNSGSVYQANTTDRVLTTTMVWAAAQYTALTDAATIAVDMSTGINFSVTLGGNRTLGNPTNPKVGQSGVIKVVQDNGGNRTLGFASNWKFPGGSAPVLSTAGNAVDYLTYYVDSTSSIVITGILKGVS